MGRLGAAAVFGLGILVAPVDGARAVTLPPATFVENVGFNVAGSGSPGFDPDPSTPDTVVASTTPTGSTNQLSGSASSSLPGGRPTLHALAIASGGGGSHQVDASAVVTYAFAVTGPASATPIPLLITYSGAGSATGFVADGLGRIQVDRITNFQVLLVDVLGVSTVFGPALDVFGSTFALGAPVDAIHTVKLEATARAVASGGTSQSEILVDPVIAIDPSFADAGLYQLVFSDNLPVSVPEPAPLASAGVVAAWGLVRRRGRRPGTSGARVDLRGR